MTEEAESTIQKIVDTFRRGESKPRTAKEELERLNEELEKQRKVILQCPHCKAPLKWKEPDGRISEIYPLIPRTARRSFTFLETAEYCPKCSLRLEKRWRLKQKVYSEERSNRDYKIR